MNSIKTLIKSRIINENLLIVVSVIGAYIVGEELEGIMVVALYLFGKILEENEDNFANKNENYIEFDTEKLRNFDKYYFNYFFNRYNVAKSVIERTEKQFEYLENNIEDILENKDEEKARKEKLKANKKRIKDIVKKQHHTY